MAIVATPRIEVAFLQMALRPHRAQILAALGELSFVGSAHLVLPVSGLPGAREVALFAWPEPLGRTRRVTIDVVRLGDAVLEAPATLQLDLAPGERPEKEDEIEPVVVSLADRRALGEEDIMRVQGPEGVVVWRRASGDVQREVQALRRDGSAIVADVDTAVFSWRLTCPRCGRVRYSKPNSLHQIFLCRICTRAVRLRRRALAQYRSRHGKKR